MSEHDDRVVAGHFEELSAERCKEFLDAAIIGRIAFAGDTHIEILPVNFVYRDPAILIRTSPYGPLSRLAAGVDGVAFEVDHHDDLYQSGWSVLASGRVEAVQDPVELEDVWAHARPSPWAAGTRTLLLRLVPDTLSGRSVRRR